MGWILAPRSASGSAERRFLSFCASISLAFVAAEFARRPARAQVDDPNFDWATY